MTAISWRNATNGDWSVAANWSTNTVPTSADAVTISMPGPYIVTISSADRANSLTFNASQAALLQNAGSLTMAARSPSMPASCRLIRRIRLAASP